MRFARSKQPLKRQALWIGVFGALFLGVELVNFFTLRSLNVLGILPRDFASIWHIFTAPFVHGSFAHFLSNLFSLILFSFLLLQFGRLRFVAVTFLLILLMGVLVWLLGRSALHIGASGLVYGYFGYLLLAGWLSKDRVLMLISLGVAIFYASLIWGISPFQNLISWESHLFGFISGLLLAYVFRARKST